MADRAHLQLNRRKIHDRSIALVLVGMVLLMPPAVGVGLIDGDIAGIPIPLLYVFAVWTLLIIGAAALSRPLRDSEDHVSSQDAPDNSD